MKKALLILIAPIIAGCSSDELAATERVFRGGMDAYYGRPAQTGYYQPVQPAVVTPVAPVYGY